MDPEKDGHDEEMEFYGDSNIASKDAPVPTWLIVSYIFWPIFGLVWFYLFWNGSWGWLDRGYWQQLQRAANTTIPFETSAYPPEVKLKKQKPPEVDSQ